MSVHSSAKKYIGMYLFDCCCVIQSLMQYTANLILYHSQLFLDHNLLLLAIELCHNICHIFMIGAFQGVFEDLLDTDIAHLEDISALQECSA